MAIDLPPNSREGSAASGDPVAQRLAGGVAPDPRRSILGILARVDPVSAIGVESKIIGLGIKGWSVVGERDLSKDDLEDCAEQPDAMLWLMGRVAWEAHMLEQRHPPQPLTRRHIDNLLQDGEVPIPVGAADTIRIGLILALQADLHSANHTILFGHLSFREFLVGRHWALILRRLVRGTGRRDHLLASLLGGRLLGTEGKSFAFLMTFINTTAAQPRPTSPLTWDDRDREALVRLMQEIFEDERQEFGERARANSRVDPRLRHLSRKIPT